MSMSGHVDGSIRGLLMLRGRRDLWSWTPMGGLLVRMVVNRSVRVMSTKRSRWWRQTMTRSTLRLLNLREVRRLMKMGSCLTHLKRGSRRRWSLKIFSLCLTLQTISIIFNVIKSCTVPIQIKRWCRSTVTFYTLNHCVIGFVSNVQ